MLYLTAILLGLAFASMCLGIFITLRVFNIPDLTADGSFTLGAVMTAVLVNAHVHWAIAIPVSCIAGFMAGSITGILYTRLSLNPLLAGILVSTALYSANLRIMSKSNMPLLDSASSVLYSQVDNSTIWINVAVLLAFVLLVGGGLVYLLLSDYGIAVRATGNNEVMARANGVNTNKAKIIGIALSNAFVALSGSLVAQLQGFADINMGIGIIVTGLGSVMMGEALFGALRLSSLPLRLLAVVTGAILFRLILAMCLSWGIDPLWLKALTAGVVLLILSVTFFKKKS